MSEYKSTEAALRAARHIGSNSLPVAAIAEIIDRETGIRDLLDVLEQMLAQAGDLVEVRSPELVVQARAVLRHSADPAPRED